MQGAWRPVHRTGTLTGLVLAAVILMLGLGASAWAAVALSGVQDDTTDELMNRRATAARYAVEAEVRRYLDAVRTVAAAAGSYDRLDTTKFVAVTAAMADTKLVGAAFVLWVVPATNEQVPTVQATWRGRGVTDLVLDVEGNVPEHFFAVMTRPLDGLPAGRQGMDLAEAGESVVALTEARRSRLPAVSDTYVLLRDRALPADRIQLSFLLAEAVHARPDSTGRRAFLGWVVMGIRGQDFIDGALGRVTDGVLTAQLLAVNGDGGEVKVGEIAEPGPPDLFRQTTIPVANRQWTLRISASGAALAGSSQLLPWVVSGGGALASVLAAGLVGVLATRNIRAEAQIRAATRELREAETQARDQANLLVAVLDTLTEGVEAVDARGAVLLRNPAARQMAGGGDRDEYLRPDGVTPYPAEELPLALAVRGHATDGLELVLHGQAGQRYLSASARPLTGAPGGAAAMVVLRDITELHAHEVELATFAGVVAHDLKAPLANIAGIAELAGEEAGELAGPAADQIRGYLHRISAAVVRASRLIDDLLAYSTARDAPLELTSVDLRALAAEVVAAHTDHLRPGVPQPDVYLGRLDRVRADPRMLRQLLDNLVGNALKYVQPGRPARVDIAAVPDQRPGWIRLEVADRGVGIPDADRARIFEAFYRSGRHGAFTGTGLGLAICRRIVERHGGSITVADNPGGGTRFLLTLPAAEPPALGAQTGRPGAAVGAT